MNRLSFPTQKSYIHGTYVSSSEGASIPNICPFTGHTICSIELSDSSLIDQAIQSAKEAQTIWAEIDSGERSKILLKAANLLRARNQELAELEVWDTGKPIAEAKEVDIITGASAIEYFAHISRSLTGETNTFSSAMSYTKRVPLGVCGALGAWNYPMQIACWKSAAALSVGNSMVFKPSEQSPITAAKLAEIYIEAGLPPGLFNVIQGDGTTGAILSSHPDIAKISLTGSVETGKKVMASAASSLKKVTMELGGKSPMIIYKDADIEEAVSGALLGNFYTQGEICSNGTRIFVERDIYDIFLDRFKERAEGLIIGNPLSDKTQVGSLISHAHANKVRSYIESGLNEGASMITGGYTPEFGHNSGLDHSAYVPPTIFADCHDQMSIVQDEIFGPVASVLKFSGEDEAINRANKTKFGLAAGVFTQDIKKAHRSAHRLEAGVCWINNYNVTPNGMPFGGFKQSGIGRENGASTLLEYTQEKSVYIEMDAIDCPYP